MRLGAVRKEGRGGRVEAQWVEPAEIQRRQLGFDAGARSAVLRPAPPYATGQVAATRPVAANVGYHAS